MRNVMMGSYITLIVRSVSVRYLTIIGKKEIARTDTTPHDRTFTSTQAKQAHSKEKSQ